MRLTSTIPTSFLLMSNRKERRAQARTGLASSNDVPLRQPPPTSRGQKTLLEIASERQILSTSSGGSPDATGLTVGWNGTSVHQDENGEAIDIIVYTLSLLMLHFTLSFLVHHQYASARPSIKDVFVSSTVATPTPVLILVLVSILHPRASQRRVQCLFAAMSVGAGIWLVYASNEDPYMAVMKKAPPLGTLWVWAITEMRWEWSLACLALVAGWGWWSGYTMF